RSEAKHELRLLPNGRCEAVITADDENDVLFAVIAPASESFRDRAAVETFAALVERNHHRPLRNNVGDRNRLFHETLADFRNAALFDFDDFNLADADAPAHLLGTLAIVFGELPFGALFHAADRGDQEPHRLSPLSGAAIAGAAGPHLFEIVEGAHFRPEDV